MQVSGERAFKEGISTRVPAGEHTCRSARTKEERGRKPDQRGSGSECVGP